MFRNPFKHFTKYDLDSFFFLVLLAFINRLLVPYRSPLADSFADLISPFYLIFGIAVLNLIIFIFTTVLGGEKFDSLLIGKQPQSAWREAYLETVENAPVKSVWVEKALDLWIVSIIISMVIFVIGGIALSLLSFSVYHFIILFFAIFTQRLFPKYFIVKKK